MLTSPSPDSRSVHRGRFVTLCQQLLALAVVLAVLTPAARTISMDVRPAVPGGEPVSVGGAYLRAASAPARVPTGAVRPDVREYGLTAPEGARPTPGSLRARTRRTTTGQQVVSDAVPVVGYGAIGVTWAGERLPDDRIGVRLRYRVDGSWSRWSSVEYHDDHGPDPDSAEARRARSGTEPTFVGDADRVQVKVATRGAAPADMRLAVVDPGADRRTARQVPEIDTATLDDTSAAASTGADTTAAGGVTATDGDATLALQATVVAPRPRIFSRQQWGADERMRDKGSLRYHEVHAGFVHHTVNANDYTRAQVPAILRSIYAYHTRSLGWSDIGYNFLVDRFGRIWEGRYGGVNRPVVGAHTLGYNDDSFAMSAIGNFETVRPRAAMIEAYGALFAWKLGLHGVRAESTSQYVTSRTFKAINGHRDAGSTACPGRYLYDRIPDIRRLVAQAQGSWRGRELESDLAGSEHPDLVVRRSSDGRGVILPLRQTDAGYKVGAPVPTNLDLTGVRNVLKAGDWDRDGHGDVIVRRRGDGTLYLHRGHGDGTFAKPVAISSGFAGVGLLAAVGDYTGDGWPDLMGQPRGGAMRIYPGAGTQGLRQSYVARSATDGARHVAFGRWNADGAPDTFVRDGTQLVLQLGNGPGGITSTRTMKLGVGRYDWLVGISDIGLKGHADLVAREKETGDLYLVPATVDGFRARVLLGTGLTKYDALVG